MSAQAQQQALAAALVELLASSPLAVARLRELLETDRSGTPHLEASAYTVASLAATLGVSARVIRGAIARGELDAAKRGGRWIISAAAVTRWAQRRYPRVLEGPGAVSRPRLGRRRSLGTVMALLETGASSDGPRL